MNFVQNNFLNYLFTRVLSYEKIDLLYKYDNQLQPEVGECF